MYSDEQLERAALAARKARHEAYAKEAGSDPKAMTRADVAGLLAALAELQSPRHSREDK